MNARPKTRLFLPVLALTAVLAACPAGQAAVLSLSSGNITIDTDTLQITGDATATGTMLGNMAVFDFDYISLGSGVNVTLQGNNPLELFSYTDLTLGTTLNASGGDGTGYVPAGQGAGIGKLGGFDGGHVKQDGKGPGHGVKPLAAGSCCGGGSGGSFGGLGGAGNEGLASLPPYGSANLKIVEGGSGGAGGGDCCGGTPTGSGGGAGGGGVSLSALGDLHLQSSAQIVADGGNGTASRSGGGGSGGAIRVVGDNVTLDSGALLSAVGGSTPFTTGSGNRGGGGGGGGRIAVFSGASLNNGATLSAAGGSGTQIGAVGSTFFGTSDGLTDTLSLGTGDFLLNIDTDLGIMAYTGDRVGLAQGNVSGGVATFHFDQIDLGPGVTVLLTGDNALSLHSDGDVSIATTLDATGGDGQPRSGASGGVGGTAPGGLGILGGGDGGRGGLGTSSTPGLPGEGPGGGGGQTSCCGGGAGGGHGGEGGLPNTDTNAALPAGATYGDPQVSDLAAEGGSGGGGGAGTNDCCAQGGGGGAGGGALEIVSQFGRITIAPTGELLVDGGDGAGVGANARTGGGGSGGALRLSSTQGIDVDGLLSADGGIGHLTSNRGGGGGGGGRIYLFAPELNLGGVAQSVGFLQSGSYLSALGGLGSTDSAGGNPGLAGTILFSAPEPSTLGLLAIGLLGLGAVVRRRRR